MHKKIGEVVAWFRSAIVTYLPLHFTTHIFNSTTLKVATRRFTLVEEFVSIQSYLNTHNSHSRPREESYIARTG